jgi:ABC-type glycerol-3-phosphate transport system permease component
MNKKWFLVAAVMPIAALPLATYLLFNYISTVPRSIMESAFIDGATSSWIWFLWKPVPTMRS